MERFTHTVAMVRRVVLACLALFVAVGSFSIVRVAAYGGGVMEIYFLDIGQGDAIYVRTPSGRDMLVDAGRSASVLRRLSEVMPWDDRFIDVVIETHPDADHIGGLPPVFDRYGIGVFLEPGIESNNSIDDEVHRMLREKGVLAVLARRGIVIDFGDGATFDILYPHLDVSRLKDPNDASVVGLMRFGGTSAMLTGDAPTSVENLLVALDGPGLKSDVLKAGHHGSRTSSDEAFVRAVNPHWVVISAGKDNTYHHPHEEVTGLFARLGIDVLRTDEEGTIGFESDGRTFLKK
jgi:competence protein ComEC